MGLSSRSSGYWRVGLNLGSSYAHVGVMAAITLFVVPIYVRVLGPSEWGIVALCITAQAVLFSIDVALGPLMLRDIARAGRHGLQKAVHARFLRLYGTIALCALLLGWLAIQGLWEAASSDSHLAWPMRLVLLQFCFQFCNNAAIGYWNGLQQQGHANLRLVIFSLAKHGLALALVLGWQQTALAYLVPFALLSAVEFLVNHHAVRAREAVALPASGPAASTSGEQVAVTRWRAFAAFGLASGIGVLSTQIDRIVLSFALDPARYGLYFIVGTLPLSLLHLQVPIHRAFLPRIAIADDPAGSALAMLRVTVLLLVLPILVMALFPEQVLWLWLRDIEIAATGAAPLRLILTGVAMIALYAPMSVLLLSLHRYRTLLLINASVLLAQLLVLAAVTPRFPMLGGALSWVACGLVQVFWAIALQREMRARQRRGLAA